MDVQKGFAEEKALETELTPGHRGRVGGPDSSPSALNCDTTSGRLPGRSQARGGDLAQPSGVLQRPAGVGPSNTSRAAAPLLCRALLGPDFPGPAHSEAGQTLVTELSVSWRVLP